MSEEKNTLCDVEVSFKNIPTNKYEGFLEEVQSLAHEWSVETHVGVGEEKDI